MSLTSDMTQCLSGTGLPRHPITRFAPSPTGDLHLGHAAHLLWVWGITRALEGTVVLRMEDHDRGRCRPEHERSIRDDLRWLGFVPDLPDPSTFASPGPSPWRQSDCSDVYAEALERLRGVTPVYGCDCTRSTMAEEGTRMRTGEVPHSESCRLRDRPWAPGMGVRVSLPDDTITVHDVRLGPLRQTPSRQCGDLLARDARGQWTYQFSVAVDDLRQGVTLVIRGEDLVESTGRQVLLARLLGRSAPPVFLHHPLLLDATGAKLSKRIRSTTLGSLRAQAESPESVLGRVAQATGLQEDARPLSVSDAVPLFRTWWGNGQRLPESAGDSGE